MVQLILFIGIGGAIGSIMRYLMGGWVQDLLRNSSFPYGTLVVNVLGCLLIGALVGVAETRQELSAEYRAFLMIGLLGGFTTFSAFGYETMSLVRDGNLLAGASNAVIHVVVGLAAVWIGYAAAQHT